MILIKTKDDLYNFSNIVDIYCLTNTIEIMTFWGEHYTLCGNNEKVYNKIQNKIIELNAKNESDCIDVEAIIKEVENE